ncbi:MAG TPA: hypothetical protein PKH24_18690 [Sedimentisphaerales bacterium]|jgi:hypothetical protein|nr:hypothetical protein [Sedimentisphaerales bacterium]HNU31052.1 hypothetical protein [Sedimentisphaerales bacterium]
MTYGLSLWLPLHGLGAAASDDIALRSGMGACASFAINFRDPQAVAALQSHLDRQVTVRPLFAADLAETGIEIRANAGGQQAIALHYTPCAAIVTISLTSDR